MPIMAGMTAWRPRRAPVAIANSIAGPGVATITTVTPT
jgi:hypothetical protein